LRQVHQTFVMYALAHRGFVPIGYRGSKQFNSMIFSNTATPPRFVLFGLLFPGGYMKTPQIFYCPAENNQQSMFNSQMNPWPPGPEFDPASKLTFAGYGGRPDVALPDDPSLYYTDPAQWRMPRLAEFKNKAIFGDLTAMPARLDTRHVSGINVLFGDGSARWIDRKVFNDDLRVITSLNAIFNPRQDAIWNALDR
jgi:prepilin-type processing-associated H-X9-DG protein